ncbi:hypothetical protein [Paenibacillus sp. FSL H3-0333]|uniref:hypothetical protein n=1 Tax=Paenibacillus sp. FSL H3-0333 TaxID=2921373 RepID=UPI0030FB757B
MTHQTTLEEQINFANEYPLLSCFNVLSVYDQIDMISDSFANACFEVYPSGISYQLLSDIDKKRVHDIFVAELSRHEIVITSELFNAMKESGHFTVITPVLEQYMNLDSSSYSAFTEVASTIQPGQKVTIVKFSEFGFPYAVNTTIDSLVVKPYAQHKDSLYVTHKPKGKRKLWRDVFHPFQDFIVYDGWLNIDIDSLTKKVVSSNSTMTIIQGNYNCFDRRYLSDIVSAVSQSPLVAFNVKEGVTC